MLKMRTLGDSLLTWVRGAPGNHSSLLLDERRSKHTKRLR